MQKTTLHEKYCSARQILLTQEKGRENINYSPEIRRHFFAFASGKGGVGKTTLCVNLALWVSLRKQKILLVDGDLGMADAHTLLGMNPQRNIASVLTSENSLKDAVIPVHTNLHFISGGSGLSSLASLSPDRLMRLRDSLDTLPELYDAVFIDCAAGIGNSVLSWISGAHSLMLVVTPSATSLLDAYGLVKVCLERGFRGGIHVISNMASSQAEAEMSFTHLNSCSIKFLKKELIYLGGIRKDQKIEKALLQRNPFILNKENSPALENFSRIGEKILTLMTGGKKQDGIETGKYFCSKS